jgi:DNA-binding IclR family transcriptional regulator
MATATRRKRVALPTAGGLPKSHDEISGGDRQFVKALARGLKILSCFSSATTHIGGTELAEMTGLPQPTVWRLCYTMMRLGYLIPSGGDRMRPGIPLLRLGQVALASIPVATNAYDRMQMLAEKFGAAVGLAALDGTRVVFVQQCLSEAQLLMNLKVGSRLRLATSGAGWGLLAGFEEAEREKLIAEFAVPDSRWAKVEAAFRREMTAYKQRGYILNIGVFHQGYNTIAVPIQGVNGKPGFALSCAGAAVTHTAAFLRKEVAPELLKVAASLEKDLRDDARRQTSRRRQEAGPGPSQRVGPRFGQ